MDKRYPVSGIRRGDEPGEYTYTRFYQVCDEYPERTALVFLDTEFTFGWLRERVDRFATALHRLGVGRQDPVMVYLGNMPQWIIANLAVQRIGAIAVPVSPIYTAPELEYITRDAGIRTIVCQDTNLGAVTKVDEAVGLDHVIVASLTEMLPEEQRKDVDIDRFSGGEVVEASHVHRFAELTDSAPPEPPSHDLDPWTDLASLMYTGGTTSEPNGVPGTHMMEVSYVRDVRRDVLGGHLRVGDDVLVMPSPLFHIMARGFFLAAGIGSASTTVLLPVPYVETVLKAVSEHGARWILGVPAMYRMVLDSDKVAEYDLSSLRYCYCGGDALPEDDLERWRALTGVPLYQVYGSTDIGHVSYGSLAEPDPAATVVGHPLATYRCQVVDPDTLDPVPDGAEGELLATADCNVKGYWGRPDQTEARWIERDDGIYFRTGDTVRMEPDGQIRFIERTPETLKYKAYRISPYEVEAALLEHEDVAEACAVGLEDDEVGEQILALVVPRDGVEEINLRRLKKWCKQRLAPYKVPHQYELRTSLRRSPDGTLERSDIRTEERRRAADRAG